MKRRKKYLALRWIRMLAGLSQGQIADQLHVDRSRISRLENGEINCAPEMMLKWIKACGVDTIRNTLLSIQSVLDKQPVRFA